MSEPIPQPGRHGDSRFAGGTEVLLVRHGESQAVIPGAAESFDPPLSVDGERQAAALADRLRPKPVDAVYTSTLARAAQTGDAVAAGRGITVARRDDLREVDLGDWEGGEFRRRAATGDPAYLAFLEAGRWEAIPGAERDDDLRARMVGAVAAIADAHPGGTVVVVSHGGAINAFLAAHFGAHRAMVASIDNTSVTTVRRVGPTWAVLGVNDHHHLGDPLLPLP